MSDMFVINSPTGEETLSVWTELVEEAFLNASSYWSSFRVITREEAVERYGHAVDVAIAEYERYLEGNGLWSRCFIVIE